jgi:hypothetical protein
MKTIRYYASGTKAYSLKNEEICGYFIDSGWTTMSKFGNPDVLKVLGEVLQDFYKKYQSEIKLLNCSESLKEKGFRELSGLEEKIFLSALKGDIECVK